MVSPSDTTLIATFYNVEPFMPVALKYPPQKIILVVNTTEGKVRQNISEIRKIFGKVARIEVERITGERVLDIAKRGVEIIDREARQSTRIMVNLSGGLRPLANGLLYACYSRPEKIYRIVSDRDRKGGIIELPKLRYNLGSTKYDVLKKIATREDESISEMAKEMHKTRGMLYQHLKELKDGGYVDEDFKITDAGRLALL